MLTMFKSSIILFAIILTVSASDGAIENDDKLILKPAELAELVLKEIIKTRHDKTTPGTKHHEIHEHAVPDMSDDIDMHPDPKIEESGDDAETLKNRKVWSRWGKWGECSVSCGEGYIARQRACVAGRCARGEREEQRRPCRRMPCPYQTSEPHESE